MRIPSLMILTMLFAVACGKNNSSGKKNQNASGTSTISNSTTIKAEPLMTLNCDYEHIRNRTTAKAIFKFFLTGRSNQTQALMTADFMENGRRHRTQVSYGKFRPNNSQVDVDLYIPEDFAEYMRATVHAILPNGRVEREVLTVRLPRISRQYFRSSCQWRQHN